MSSSEPSSQPRAARRGRRRAAAAALLAAALGLAGCGFQPLYGEGPAGPADERFAEIRVGVIPERSGQILRNFLIQRLNPGGRPADPAYTLAVSLRERQQQLAITQEDVAERANLLVTARYALRDLDSNQVVFEGRQTTITSFNILRDEVATLSAEQDARQRALRALSDDIRLRLGLYFQRDHQTPAEPEDGDAPAADMPGPGATAPTDSAPSATDDSPPIIE
jgi:LPS-assembly lipoprotein